jgi:hypothetical protein
MRRWLLVGVMLLAALAAGWWLSRPTPGTSLFAGWQPQAKRKVWTIAGSPGSKHFVFVDSNGAFQPRRDSYSIHYFVYDRDKRQLYSSLLGNVTNVRRSAFSGDTPAPRVDWDAAGFGFSQTVFAALDTCCSRVRIANHRRQSRRLSLFVVAVPYGVTGAMPANCDLRYDSRSRSIRVGGSVLVSCDAKPADGAAYAAASTIHPADITGYIRNGVLPRGAFARGRKEGVTSGALRFDLTLGLSGTAEVVLRSPMAEVSISEWSRSAVDHRPPFDTLPRSFDELRMRRSYSGLAGYANRLGRVGLTLPDRKCEDCFRASLAYLVMLSADGKPVPGPTKYRGFWVRDCAYMADALYYGGQRDLIPPALEQLRAMQLSNGGFPPKFGAQGDDELDAPGEVIYALVQHYRRTGDLKWLGEQWQCISNASRYIRAKGRGEAFAARPSDVAGSSSNCFAPTGILPASVSAEDLGDRLQQHYWDDFWCIRGLRDAAFAARALGKREDAAWISAEAESLLSATKASIRDTMTHSSVGYIPNGPDEAASSAAARGTSCALWPCAALDPADPLVTRSYDDYWGKWIAPSGGGFVHRGHYWPYAGLDLAQGYLMLGQRARAWTILHWTLDHDPTRGFFAWPEGMSTKDLTLAEGDMPHGWMCAAVVSLVRNMLVRESGGDLVLLSGVPKEWLRPGAELAIRDFPTEFGKVSYRAKVSNGNVKLTFSGARPRGRYRIALPGRSVVDVPSSAQAITIPNR